MENEREGGKLVMLRLTQDEGGGEHAAMTTFHGGSIPPVGIAFPFGVFSLHFNFLYLKIATQNEVSFRNEKKKL